MLDRYVTRSFLTVFVGTLVLFTFGVAALDFFSRVGHFLDEGKVAGTFAEGYSRPRLVLEFYAAYLPFLVKEVLPFVTVTAALLTLSTMLRNNEVFPVLAAGVSVRRLFAPLFACGLLIALVHMGFQEYLVPALSRQQVALKRFFSGDRTNRLRNLPHLRDGHGTVARVAYFTFADWALHDVIVQRPWTDAGFERILTPKLVPDGDGWRAPEGGRIEPAAVDALPRELPRGAHVDFGVTPADVEALASKHGTVELSYSQLARMSKKFPNRLHLKVALHKQVARPLVSFAMLLCGVPLLLAAGRSLFLGGALAFGLSAGYYLLDIFFTSLGDRGDLPPVFAAYFPLALLVSLGISCMAVVKT